MTPRYAPPAARYDLADFAGQPAIYGPAGELVQLLPHDITQSDAEALLAQLNATEQTRQLLHDSGFGHLMP